MKQFLAERHPEARGEFVRAIAVFMHPLCELEVDRAQVTVARYSKLLQVVLDIGKQRRMTAVVAGRLAQSLAGSQA